MRACFSATLRGNVPSGTFFETAPVALNLVERRFCKADVPGSNPGGRLPAWNPVLGGQAINPVPYEIKLPRLATESGLAIRDRYAPGGI